jgi:hypothetical protein
METSKSKASIANTLFKCLERIPVTYQDEQRIIWGDINDKWYISLYVFKDSMLKIEYGHSSHEEPFHAIYLQEDESYNSLIQLLQKKNEIITPSLTDERFNYIRKVITIMLFHKLEMKRGNEV